MMPAEQAWRALSWSSCCPRRWSSFNAARPIPAGGTASTLFAVFSREHISTTLKAALYDRRAGGYYAVATWLPTCLKVTRTLSVFNTGAYLFVIIIGAFFGFIIAAI